MEFGTNSVDIGRWAPDEREQIAWKVSNEVAEPVLTGFSEGSAVGWVWKIEESA